MDRCKWQRRGAAGNGKGGVIWSDGEIIEEGGWNEQCDWNRGYKGTAKWRDRAQIKIRQEVAFLKTLVEPEWCQISPPTMCGIRVCVYLALMLLVSGLCQVRGFGDLWEQLEEAAKEKRDLVALNRHRVLQSLQPSQIRPSIQRNRLQRPGPRGHKKTAKGPRFALSLDVPTSILSALIDLAKNQEMRAKAAANAQLMARIGKKK
ncbi:hypothetical protein GJAV_G00174070 [Gymnothorax javanicus]|nr:hypothetical protein GJAV_G00174070 [Gymnothorax javanicus]